MVRSDERAPYNLIIVIISVECGAEECGANFHAVNYKMATCSNAINKDAESDWTPIVYVTQTLYMRF